MARGQRRRRRKRRQRRYGDQERGTDAWLWQTKNLERRCGLSLFDMRLGAVAPPCELLLAGCAGTLSVHREVGCSPAEHAYYYGRPPINPTTHNPKAGMCVMGFLRNRAVRKGALILRVCPPAREPETEKPPKVLPKVLSGVLSEIGVLSGVLPRVLSRGSFCKEHQEELPREHSREHSCDF